MTIRQYKYGVMKPFIFNKINEQSILKQGKSEGFDSCDWPSNLNLDSNCRFFSLCDLEIWWWPQKTIGHVFYIMSSFVNHFKSIGEFKLELQSGNAQFGSKLVIFCGYWLFFPCDLEIWWITLGNNRAPVLYYIKLCASFQIHQWSQTWVTVRKRSIRVEIGDFLSRVTLKFDGWPWKTIGHLFCTTLSFVHHFKAMGEFNLELQSGNAWIWSKSAIFLSCVTLKFERWPWKTIGHLSYAASSFVYHFIAVGEFKLGLQSWNAQIGSKSTIFFPQWPWNFTYDLEKQ